MARGKRKDRLAEKIKKIVSNAFLLKVRDPRKCNYRTVSGTNTLQGKEVLVKISVSISSSALEGEGESWYYND